MVSVSFYFREFRWRFGILVRHHKALAIRVSPGKFEDRVLPPAVGEGLFLALGMRQPSSSRLGCGNPACRFPAETGGQKAGYRRIVFGTMREAAAIAASLLSAWLLTTS